MTLLVFGIMRARDAQRAHAAANGKLELVEYDDVAVLVSPLPNEGARMRRETILAHADLLQASFEHGPVLPLRLGTALPDTDAVRRELLAPRAEQLARRLDALDGKAELQLKAIYREAPLLQSILDNNAALRRAVDRSRTLPTAATHFEQIRIGEAVAGAVQARRATDGDALLSELRPLALAVSVAAPNHERAVLNAAFLIETDRLDRFDAAVERISEEYAASIEFKLIGPLPPYSFADAELEPIGASRTSA